MDDHILDAWNIHNRIQLYVLDAIAPDALGASLARGRSVGQVFAHIHNTRLMWLEVAGPEFMAGLEKVEKDQAGDKTLLHRSLADSGRAIESLLKKGIDAGGKIKGFKPHVTAFLGYLIAHDAYHQGEVGMLLSQAGHALDKKVAYGIWEWGSR